MEVEQVVPMFCQNAMSPLQELRLAKVAEKSSRPMTEPPVP
jgi:hypothetical protein